jgi:hypothetical protein
VGLLSIIRERRPAMTPREGDGHGSRRGVERVLGGVQTTMAPSPATLPLPPWEGTSAHGCGVRLTRESNGDLGATPYYVVAYGVPSGSKGGAQAIRYAPSRERARDLLTWFLRDVTDPAELCTALLEVTRRPGRFRVQYSERPSYGGHRLPRLRRLSAARGFWSWGGARPPPNDIRRWPSWGIHDDLARGAASAVDVSGVSPGHLALTR